MQAETPSPVFKPSHFSAPSLNAQETVSLKGGGTVIAGHHVGHIAHLAGALAGVLLVYCLSRLPAVSKH